MDVLVEVLEKLDARIFCGCCSGGTGVCTCVNGIDVLSKNAAVTMYEKPNATHGDALVKAARFGSTLQLGTGMVNDVVVGVPVYSIEGGRMEAMISSASAPTLAKGRSRAEVYCVRVRSTDSRAWMDGSCSCRAISKDIPTSVGGKVREISMPEKFDAK